MGNAIDIAELRRKAYHMNQIARGPVYFDGNGVMVGKDQAIVTITLLPGGHVKEQWVSEAGEVEERTGRAFPEPEEVAEEYTDDEYPDSPQ